MSRMKNMNHFGEEAVLFISVINQLDAHNFCFTINLFHASTCFEHMCSSSGGQNCTHHTYRCDDTRGCVMHTYSCDDTRGCVIQFWPPDDEHMCSKHVEAWNKHIVKQKFCSSSWLITEINIPRCTVSKTLKKKKTMLWWSKVHSPEGTTENHGSPIASLNLPTFPNWFVVITCLPYDTIPSRVTGACDA